MSSCTARSSSELPGSYTYNILTFNRPVTFVLAHKGLSASAPENTMPAFRSAMEMGADGFETDVQMTSDGVPVCSHSYTVNSHSDGKGAIHDYTLEDLKKLDFGSWKGEGFKGTEIATLDECLSVLNNSGIANLELKTPFVKRKAYIDSISQCLDGHGMGKRVIVSSFDHALMSEFLKANDDCGIGVLMLPVFKEIDELIEIIGECFPTDVPLDSISADDVTPLDDVSFIEDFLGVEGATPEEVFLSLGKTLGGMFPGKTFGHVSEHVMSQSDIPTYLEKLDFEPDYVFCHYISCFMEPDVIESIHELGKKVVVWTVDSPEHAKRLSEMGADGIITDKPTNIIEALPRHGSRGNAQRKDSMDGNGRGRIWAPSRSSPVEIGFLALAPGAVPIIRQFLEGRAGGYPLSRVPLLRIVHETADAADVLPCGGTVHDLAYGHGFRRVIQIDHPQVVQVLVSQRRVGGEVHRGIRPDERTHPVESLPSGRQVLVDDGELVGVQCLVRIGYVPMEHEEQIPVLGDDDAVPLGVPLGLYYPYPIGHLLCSGETMIRAVAVGEADDVVPIQVQRVGILRGYVDLGVREGRYHAGMVVVLVCDQYLGYAVGGVASRPKGIEVVLYPCPHVYGRPIIGYRIGNAVGHSGIHQDDLLIRLDDEILETGTVSDGGIESCLILSSESERLGHESVLVQLHSFDYHS